MNSVHYEKLGKWPSFLWYIAIELLSTCSRVRTSQLSAGSRAREPAVAAPRGHSLNHPENALLHSIFMVQ